MAADESVFSDSAGDGSSQAYLYGGDGDNTLEALDPVKALGDLTPAEMEGGTGPDTYR